MDTQPIVAITYKGQVLAMPFSLFVEKFGIEESKRNECEQYLKNNPISQFHIGEEVCECKYIEDIGTQVVYRLGVLGVKFITK